MSYEETINEVIAQYDLTPPQRAAVRKQVNDSPCPWYRSIIYSRTHTFASQAAKAASSEAR